MWTICKVFIEFVTILLLFYVFWFFGHEACGNLSSLTRGRTHSPCIGRQSLNHWTAREVLKPRLNVTRHPQDTRRKTTPKCKVSCNALISRDIGCISTLFLLGWCWKSPHCFLYLYSLSSSSG